MTSSARCRHIFHSGLAPPSFVIMCAGDKLGTVVVGSMQEAAAIMEWHAQHGDPHRARPLRIWPLSHLHSADKSEQQRRAMRSLPAGTLFVGL